MSTRLMDEYECHVTGEKEDSYFVKAHTPMEAAQDLAKSLFMENQSVKKWFISVNDGGIKNYQIDVELQLQMMGMWLNGDDFDHDIEEE